MSWLRNRCHETRDYHWRWSSEPASPARSAEGGRDRNSPGSCVVASLSPARVYDSATDYNDSELVTPKNLDQPAVSGNGRVASAKQLTGACAGPTCLTRQM